MTVVEKSARPLVLNKMEKQLTRPEWVANLAQDEKGLYISSVNTAGMAGSIWSGISFWTQSDLVFINKLLHDVDWNNPATKNCFGMSCSSHIIKNDIFM